jgi:hypothetical protein
MTNDITMMDFSRWSRPFDGAGLGNDAQQERMIVLPRDPEASTRQYETQCLRREVVEMLETQELGEGNPPWPHEVRDLDEQPAPGGQPRPQRGQHAHGVFQVLDHVKQRNDVEARLGVEVLDAAARDRETVLRLRVVRVRAFELDPGDARASFASEHEKVTEPAAHLEQPRAPEVLSAPPHEEGEGVTGLETAGRQQTLAEAATLIDVLRVDVLPIEAGEEVAVGARAGVDETAPPAEHRSNPLAPARTPRKNARVVHSADRARDAIRHAPTDVTRRSRRRSRLKAHA